VATVNATEASSSGGFIWATQAFAPNMVSGANVIQIVGRAGSTFNSGYIGYRYSGAGSASNLLTFGHFGADNLMNLDGNGNLLIATTSRTAAGINNGGTLQVNKEIMAVGSQAGIFWENRSGGVTSNSNWYGFYAPNSTNTLLYNGTTNIASINNSSGAYTALSDVTKKKDFETSEIGLSVVMQLQPTLFRMLDDAPDAPKQLGFIAQEVKDVLPHAYVETTLLDAGNKESTYIGLQDRPIIAALVKAVQELNTRLEAVENK
jgi:hypothetical protein